MSLVKLTPQEEIIRKGLVKHVDVLAGLIGERNTRRPSALDAAAAYVSRTLRDSGYVVAEQAYVAGPNQVTVKNLDTELCGRDKPEQIILVGAHYDSVLMCPGANDNGTGVAGLLEIANLLATWELAKTVRFAAFVNEEPPYFRTGEMGSRVYARRCRERGEDIRGMICLETIGCYSDAPGSQRYPIPMWFPLNLIYPSTGNFIGFVSNFSSARLAARCARRFRKRSSFPCKKLVAPGNLTGVGFSDHESFWLQGYRAIMVTDTAPFRYVHYHQMSDTPDKIDYERTARVVVGLAEMTADLAR